MATSGTPHSPAKHQRFNFMLKYADYTQGVLASARDTDKLWMQVEG
jgi:hypothetical protein